MEEKHPLVIMVGGDNAVKAFNPGHTVHILIESELNFFQVYFRNISKRLSRYSRMDITN